RGRAGPRFLEDRHAPWQATALWQAPWNASLGAAGKPSFLAGLRADFPPPSSGTTAGPGSIGQTFPRPAGKGFTRERPAAGLSTRPTISGRSRQPDGRALRAPGQLHAGHACNGRRPHHPAAPRAGGRCGGYGPGRSTWRSAVAISIMISAASAEATL